MMVDRFGVINFSVIRVCRNVVGVFKFIFVVLMVIKRLNRGEVLDGIDILKLI